MQLLGLVLISSLAFFWTADARCSRNSQCKDDERCINTIFEGECIKKGTIGRAEEATTSTSTGSRGPRGKNAQHYRDYRTRKRAEQEKQSLNRTSDPSTTADSSTINVAGCEV
ncbi:uncharacterized protein [Parasteatoda tepidariorum]|uniref:uncharacterized protein n=1 Tax=Parasteatoda tepidariorum TaxID=114398 RepID=UPI0039BCE0B8